MTAMNTLGPSKGKKAKTMRIEVPDIRRLSLKRDSLLLVDDAIQSRVGIDPAHVQFLSGELAIYGDLKPIQVYWDGKRYIVYNGFHRVRTYLKAGREDIPAIVKDGTYRDAIIESARNNDDTSLAKTREDRKKSAMLLFSDDEWFSMTATEVARHVGISSPTAARYRNEYCSLNKKKPPEMVKNINGFFRETYRNTGHSARRYSPPTMTQATNRAITNIASPESPSASAGGKAVLVSTAEEPNDYVPGTRKLSDHIARLGVFSQPAKFRPYQLGINGYIGDGFVFVSSDIYTIANLKVSVFDVQIIRQSHCPKGRAIVVCRPEDGPAEVLDLARQLGVEFLTPDEFVASVKDQSTPNPKDTTPCLD